MFCGKSDLFTGYKFLRNSYDELGVKMRCNVTLRERKVRFVYFRLWNKHTLFLCPENITVHELLDGITDAKTVRRNWYYEYLEPDLIDKRQMPYRIY
jgi:hypothetical protein